MEIIKGYGQGEISTKKYLTDEIIESPLKKESTSKKNNNTHRNKKKNLNTTNLMSFIFFTVKKFLYSSFVASTCFLKQCNPTGDSFLRKDYFSPSVIWPLVNTKIFVKASSKRKKFENFFEKIVFLFNTGNGKYDCNNII